MVIRHIHREFKVFIDTVISGPYTTFSIGRLADLHRCEMYISYWTWIEV